MPAQPSARHTIGFEAIGTVWSIDIYDRVEPTHLAGIEAAVLDRVEQFDKHYSRFRPDSLISAMAQTAGTYELPPDAQPMFDLYQRLYDQTSGAVTPLIGQVLSDAGYDAAYSLKPRSLTTPPAWDDVLSYNFPHLTLAAPALLDLGAAGKGYLVDIVAQLLEDQGILAYCVDASGDLRYRNNSGPALRVGLEHPSDPTQVIGVAELEGEGISLCGSAGNRRAWSDFHHVIDPLTLTSPRHIQALWVTAGSTILADALTTALYFVEGEALSAHYNFQYALVGNDGMLECSSGFPAEFFTT